MISNLLFCSFVDFELFDHILFIINRGNNIIIDYISLDLLYLFSYSIIFVRFGGLCIILEKSSNAVIDGVNNRFSCCYWC